MKYFNNIDELKNCIGKVVFFYYTKNGEIEYAWAKKITKVKPSDYLEYTLRGIEVWGTDCVVFQDIHKHERENPIKKIIPRVNYTKEQMSNAQEYARELTLEEKFIYRRLIKKYEYQIKQKTIV